MALFTSHERICMLFQKKNNQDVRFGYYKPYKQKDSYILYPSKGGKQANIIVSAGIK